MRGSIVKRGRTYSYVLYLGRDESGRKRQKWVGGFRTKKDAEVALVEALGRVHTGTYTDPRGITVGEYLEQWLEGISTTVREKTAARLVVLHPRTADALRAHRKRQLEERMAVGGWDEGDWVFANEVGDHLYPDRITKQFGKLVEEADLPRIRLHDLRHTVATLALTAGVHAKIVQELLGHSSITVTLDTYSHVAPGIHERAALAIGALIYNVDDPTESQGAPRPRRAHARRARQQISLEEE